MTVEDVDTARASRINGMNLEAFIHVINQLFEMAEVCGTE
jgi:hypothetical protein